MATIEQIIDLAGRHLEKEELVGLEKGYEYALKIYNGKKHLSSGKPYISHALAVCFILSQMRLDSKTLLAGLLHGVLKEDPSLSFRELSDRFGNDVANIVRGATKITNVKFDSRLTYQAENVRKLLLAMASDLRVLLVKLADRLHDMRSFALNDWTRELALAQETMELYAPLASRLGIDWMKRELEDLAFSFLHPDEYQDLRQRVASSTADREAYVEEVIGILRRKLAENNVVDCEIIGRPKHLYSIYKKIIAQKIPLEKVYDKVAFRIIVNTVKECYQALGVVHENWAPVPGRIKDFISSPKANNYQSMHTTVLGPRKEFMEVQIRTREMDRVAQEGIAAHWAYKEGQAVSARDAKVFKSLKQLVHWLQELKDPREFLDSVRDELFEPDVYCLTPMGEVKELLLGSTPIDFAYLIHTEVGNHCSGAKVNNRIVPLKYRLQNGDKVEIITSPKQKPRRGWLSIVRTSRAKSRIRHWLRQEEREKSINVGREICERELRKYNTTLKKIIRTGHIKELLKGLHCNSLEDLLAKVGSGGITVKTLTQQMQPPEIRVAAEKREQDLQVPGTRVPHTDDKGVIVVQGMDDMLVHISQCCLPVPGDQIMGFITTGRGISIHKRGCANLLATDPLRRVEVAWSAREQTVHRARIRLVTENRKGMLAEVSALISKQDANILELEVKTRPDNLAAYLVAVEVEGLAQLQHLLRHLRQLDGVVEAHRG